MKVLVDTSIWIEYFRAHPHLSEASLGFLSLLLEDDRVVTIYPVHAELLSGKLAPAKEKDIRNALDALGHIDLDWNTKPTWDQIIDLGRRAHKAALPVPGIVDRMILAATKHSNASLWTLDQGLNRLAQEVSVKTEEIQNPSGSS